MLVAILLIGFTISKMNERNVIQEKVRYGKGWSRIFSDHGLHITRQTRSSVKGPAVKEELLDFVALYAKGKGFLDVVVVDPDMKMIAANNPEVIDLSYSNDELRQAIQTGSWGQRLEGLEGSYPRSMKG